MQKVAPKMPQENNNIASQVQIPLKQLVIIVAVFVLTCLATCQNIKQQVAAESNHRSPLFIHRQQITATQNTTQETQQSQTTAPSVDSNNTPEDSPSLWPPERRAAGVAAINLNDTNPQRLARMANDQLMADFVLGSAHEIEPALETRQFPPETGAPPDADSNSLTGSKLRIVRLFAPEATQNATNNITLDCMFAFDKKLDRRLTIKWFFNDQVEPIYQWIPELNKRVYSDAFERFLDKSYEVNEDAEFMLQAYRLLQQQQPQPHRSPESSEASADGEQRSLLASRLSKLAKLGGRQSRQLLDSLRAALYLDEELEYGRFRALRLLQPTSELSGRYTCLVSSLEGEDMQSTRLIVYEPPKSLTFNVTRLPNLHQYNLTCRAEQVSPQPSLSLHRFRAGPSQGQPAAATQEAGHNHHLLARLAGSSVRQEPLANAQLHLEPSPTTAGAFDALAWALVDESSLSGTNLLTHFECRLSIEGSPYEQRQTLALQRGWHINSAAASGSGGSRQTLVGLFSAFVSLLCLALALVSSALIFKLLRRHANNRVHIDHKQASLENNQNSTSGAGSGDFASSLSPSRDPINRPATATVQQVARSRSSFTGNAIASKPETGDEPEGVYRVPDSAYGTRYVIASSLRTQQQQQQQQRSNNNNNTLINTQPQQHLPHGLATSGLYCDQKPLYC